MNNIINEEWKILDEYPNYSISNYGKIRNNKTQRILKNDIVYYKLINNEKKIQAEVIRIPDRNNYKVNIKVHQLVMSTFGVSKPSDKHTIDHIDRNPLNNYISNLRWATKKEQSANRKNTRKNSIKFSTQDIDDFYKRTKLESLTVISKDIGIPMSALFNVLRYVHPEY